MKKDISFRPMTVDDIDSVLHVEHHSFPNPWTRETFYNELTRNRFANYLLLLHSDTVIGYCGMWIIVDEAHITNIAVLPNYRGQNLGEALLIEAMETAKALGVRSMTLEVRVSNRVAQNLYEKLGFKIGGIRKHYYTDNGEDAYVMWVKFNAD